MSLYTYGCKIVCVCVVCVCVCMCAYIHKCSWVYVHVYTLCVHMHVVCAIACNLCVCMCVWRVCLSLVQLLHTSLSCFISILLPILFVQPQIPRFSMSQGCAGGLVGRDPFSISDLSAGTLFLSLSGMPRLQTGKNGENWLQNHLWCPNDPHGEGIDDWLMMIVHVYVCVIILVF